nr:hypothetical protein [uncultured Rhodopila sp.]
MENLRNLFYLMSYRYAGQTLALKQRFFKSNSLIVSLSLVATIAPVIESSGYFQFDPTPKPAKASWRWIIAARCGIPLDQDCRFYPPLLSPDLDYAQQHALEGNDVLDLVACSQDLMRVTSRYTGLAAVVGWPTEPEWADQPVRIHETPLAWLLAQGRGVFLAGEAADQQSWLRACSAGIIASSITSGEAIKRKMQRPIPRLPRILVEA